MIFPVFSWGSLSLCHPCFSVDEEGPTPPHPLVLVSRPSGKGSPFWVGRNVSRTTMSCTSDGFFFFERSLVSGRDRTGRTSPSPPTFNEPSSMCQLSPDTWGDLDSGCPVVEDVTNYLLSSVFESSLLRSVRYRNVPVRRQEKTVSGSKSVDRFPYKCPREPS